MADEKAEAQEAAELLGAPHEPCPCCQLEVRNLFAVAYNTAIRYPTLHELRSAVERMQPLMDHHFAGVRNG